MKPVFLFYIHIPKTAGSTFGDILRRNLGPQVAREYGVLNDYRYTKAQLEKVLTDFPNLRGMTSHRLSLDLPWDFERMQVVGIAFVRDPGRRLLSLYFYNRNLDNYYGQPETKELSVREFFRRRLGALDRGEGNDQLRQLTGNVEEAGLAAVANRMASHPCLLLPSERFDEACLVLGRRFPGMFQNLRYERMKVSTRDQEVPADLVEEYSRRSELDRRLHAMAEENLDRMIAEHYPDREELQRALGAFAS